MAKHIVIIGAGISGLAAAWYLKKKHGSNIDITILEKSSRPGGWIHTVQNEGFLFEQGPRSCRSSGTGFDTLQLIEDLGLQDQVIIANPAAKTRYLYINKKLKSAPWGLFFLAQNLLPALWRDWREPRGKGDESIKDFISRRLHPSFAEYLIDPLTSGIYAGDISKLSVRSCFSLLSRWEQEHGSLIKGAWHHTKKTGESSQFIQKVQKFPLFSLKEGMESLVKEIVKKLEAQICYNCEVTMLEDQKEEVQVSLSDGRQIMADELISTLPSSDLHYTSVAVVSLGYRQNLLPKQGFGYLIPSNQGERILGCVWDSSIFPQQNRVNETRLTVMLGGAHHEEVASFNESEIEKIALESLQNQMGITAYPDAITIKIARCAIPQYEVGHQEWVSRIQSSLSSRHAWIGSAFNGVSVNDCIANAKKRETPVNSLSSSLTFDSI